MTPTELIEETVEFYAEDPEERRASNGGACFYLVDGGEARERQCAVGRCLRREVAEALNDKMDIAVQDLADDPTLVADFHPAGLDDLLRPEYRGFDLNLWRDLQKLHDEDAYWDPGGLTVDGEKEREILIEKWELREEFNTNKGELPVE